MKCVSRHDTVEYDTLYKLRWIADEVNEFKEHNVEQRKLYESNEDISYVKKKLTPV